MRRPRTQAPTRSDSFEVRRENSNGPRVVVTPTAGSSSSRQLQLSRSSREPSSHGGRALARRDGRVRPFRCVRLPNWRFKPAISIERRDSEDYDRPSDAVGRPCRARPGLTTLESAYPRPGTKPRSRAAGARLFLAFCAGSRAWVVMGCVVSRDDLACSPGSDKPAACGLGVLD